jgi:hypothetical protein
MKMSGIDLELTVPCVEGCTSLSQQFTLEPALPNGNDIKWPTKLGGNVVDSLSVKFASGDDALEQEQYAEFIVVIPESFEGWSFYANGIEMLAAFGNCQYKFIPTIISPNIVKIKMSKLVSKPKSFYSTELNLESLSKVTKLTFAEDPLVIDFRYILEYKSPGPDDGIYMSQDPKLSSRR